MFTSSRAVSLLRVVICMAGLAFLQTSVSPASTSPSPSVAGVQTAAYNGEGLSVAPIPQGARLQTAFQKLEGELTREGLRLTSTAKNDGASFRVSPSTVGRVGHAGHRLDSGVVETGTKLARL